MAELRPSARRARVLSAALVAGLFAAQAACSEDAPPARSPLAASPDDDAAAPGPAPAPSPSPGLEDDETPEAEAHLASLGVEPDEIGELGDEELVDVDTLPRSTSPDGAPDSDLEKITWLDEALDDLPDELPEPNDVEATVDLDGPAGFAGPSPEKLPLADWWKDVSPCGYGVPAKYCVCRGSPFNCEFPNAQPGGNRYLPPATMRLLKRIRAREAREQIVDYVGKWDVPEGTPMVDGLGALRGTLKRPAPGQATSNSCWSFDEASGKAVVRTEDHPCVKVNFGLKKRMTAAGAAQAEDFVYAFSTELGSSWIPLTAVRAIVKDGAGQPAFKAYDRPAPRPVARVLRSVSVTKFRSAEDFGVTFAQFEGSGVALRYLPRWARLKVRPKSEVAQAVDPRGRGPSEMARDYLLRDGNAVNLLYQTPLLGGAATDTFIVRKDGLSFRRLRTTNGKKTVLKIWLYEPLIKDGETVVSAGTKRRGKMYFVYGRAGGRYGWVAAEALRTSDACAKGADGWFCAPDGTGYLCDDGKLTERKSCAQPGFRCTGTSDVDKASLAPSAELVCDQR